MKKILFSLLAVLASTSAFAQDNLPLPHPGMTPGAVMTTDKSVFCEVGYTLRVRDVSPSLKEKVYRNYGIGKRKPFEYKIDHLVSLQLGGSNDISNLWPISLQTQPWNAHRKDQLENRLKKLVCTGQMPVEEAQQRIAKDWISEYIRQFGQPK